MVLSTAESPQVLELERDMLHLQAGEHLCLIYDADPVEQMPALAPFLSQGLRSNERCIYIADDFTLDGLEASLNEFGVDVRGATATGALKLWTRSEWRQPGELDSSLKAAQVRAMIEDALRSGFTGVRFAVEMTWTLGPDITPARLRHWEAMINTIFTPDVPARIVCQYSRRKLAPDVIHAGLVTHPVAVIDQDVCPNPYFEDPLTAIAEDPLTAINASRSTEPVSPLRIEWMLTQLKRARKYEREHQRRMEAEDALATATRKLEQERDLTRIAAEKLRRANVVKDEFIGMVSHELRTPITVILGNAQVLLKTLPLHPGPHRDALMDIRMEAERLRRVVTNLLSFAAGDTPPSIDALSLSAIVRRSVQDHRSRFAHRTIQTAFADNDSPILGNEGYIEQALGNLLINAERYSPRDSVIELVVASHEGWPSVTVKDRGIGILDTDVERVFEPFYRASSATKAGPAVGIGLTVSKRLIEAQGGYIWARSREGGGAEFGFALPACPTASSEGA